MQRPMLTIKLFELLDRFIAAQVIEGSTGTNKVSLDIVDWSTGVYAVRLSDSKGWTAQKKLIVRY